jgi:SET domain-containing protein
MYIIQTRLGRSTIPGAGIGLFAAEPLKKGQIVWNFTSWHREFDPEDMDELPEVAQDLVLFYGYFSQADQCYALDVDNGRFTNHSEQPTLISAQSDDGKLGCLQAARDIAVGEELTINYRLIDGMASHPKLRRGKSYRDFLDHVGDQNENA